MNICLSDHGNHLTFAPLSLTKPVGKLRMGIFTFEERIKRLIPEAKVSFETEDYLQVKFAPLKEIDIVLAANVFPTNEMLDCIKNREAGQYTWNGQTILSIDQGKALKPLSEEPLIISERWHLFTKNKEALKYDWDLVDKSDRQHLSNTVTVIGDPNLVYLAPGASAEACVLNTKDGPIYLGPDSSVMEGSLVKGPFALCDHASLKMGTKMYGDSTVGPHCKVGGEVGNSVIQGYSNKGHDGYMGNSLIGEWCNLGADTNTSNLKNNYSLVRTFDYRTENEITTDQQFMGLTMGDHSKCGINTMFNTATVVGVSCNIYGGDFPSKYLPSFSWGGVETVTFKIDKAFEAAENMMKRRGIELTDADKSIFRHLHPQV